MRDAELKDWKHDESLRQRTAQMLDAREWTQAVAAKRFNLSSATRLSKYLALDGDRAPESDMPEVEKSIRNWFRHQDRREGARLNLFENKISEHVAARLRQIRRTGDIGVIYGAAGLGKTCGIELFQENEPNTLVFTTTRWSRSAVQLQNSLFEQINANGDWSCAMGVRKSEWMVTEMRGSERLIIIDQAHKLHYSGVDWLADFNEATGCPVALVGNIEVLNIVRMSDQLTSRIGLVDQVNVANDHKAVATKLIEQYAKGANGDLVEPVAAMISGSGHCRAVRKRLTLTTDIVETAKDGNWLRAWDNAGTKLVKPGPTKGRR
jgi:DNA transposition AAA+ family ATPase